MLIRVLSLLVLTFSLAANLRAQDAPPPDEAQGIDGSQGSSVGGSGISRGVGSGHFTPLSVNPKLLSGGDGSSTGSEDGSGDSTAACPVEDVTWKPGNVNPNIDISAWHIIPQGKTVSYRIYEGQLSPENGTLIQLYESRASMFLSRHACTGAAYTAAARLDGCHALSDAGGGGGSIQYWGPAKAAEITAGWKKQHYIVGKDVPVPCSPVPAGKLHGLNFWYLNVKAADSCGTC